MALSFRLATEADVSEILRLRLAIDADQEQRFDENRWTTTINEKSVIRSIKSSRTLLAVQRGQIVGTVRMETKKPWAVDLKYFTPVCKAVYLHDVNVDPQLQRSGIGSRLINRAKKLARKWPVEAIRLDSYDGPAGAGPFYLKCGFTELGHKVYRGVPLVYFEFLL